MFHIRQKMLKITGKRTWSPVDQIIFQLFLTYITLIQFNVVYEKNLTLKLLKIVLTMFLN